MKVLLVFAIFACLVFPVFSEDPNTPRYRELSDSMGTTVSSSTSTLGNFDLVMLNNNQLSTYTSYKGQYDNLVNSLRESETRLSRLIRTNAQENRLREERDIYARLIERLEAVKAEFDNWLQGVQ